MSVDYAKFTLYLESRRLAINISHLPSAEDNLCYQYRPSTPWAPRGRSLIKDWALGVNLPAVSSTWVPIWSLGLALGVWYYDPEPRGFKATGFICIWVFLIFPTPRHINNSKRSDLDQTASREASLDIFRRFSRWRGPTLRTFIKTNGLGRMLRWRYWWGWWLRFARTGR